MFRMTGWIQIQNASSVKEKTLSSFGFSSFGIKSLTVKFTCDVCNAAVKSEEIFVPEPNYSAEKSRDSQVIQDGSAVCESCHKEFEINLYVSFGGGYGEIEGLPDNTDIELIEIFDTSDSTEFQWETPSTVQFEIFKKHVSSINKLLMQQLDAETEFSLLVMLYAHVVAATEQFLSSVFIREVANSDSLIKKLIETDPEFGKRKLSLKDIYQESEQIKNTVEIYLKSLIFHDLQKIKPMYMSVLNYDFGNISWLFQAVLKRHDCVHRAGYEKDGEKVNINRDDVIDLIINCKILAANLDSHIINPTVNDAILEVCSNIKTHAT